MKSAIFVVFVFVSTCGMPAVSGYDATPKQEPKKLKEDGQDLSALMQRKLESSQKVLEGLATNNFDKIGKHAEELINISKQAEWKILQTPEYELNSNQFRRSAEDLVKKATDKNLDGATLAYVDLTLTCVRCHKYVREIRRVQLDSPGRPVVARSDR